MKGSGAQWAKILKKFQFREEATLKIWVNFRVIEGVFFSEIGVTIWVQAVSPQKNPCLWLDDT